MQKYGKVFNVSAKEEASKVDNDVDFLKRIEITGEYKKNYLEGERFEYSPQTLKMTAYCAGGKIEDDILLNPSITWKYSPVGPLTEDDTFIEFFYEKKGRIASYKLPITVEKTMVDPPIIINNIEENNKTLYYNGVAQSPEYIIEEKYVRIDLNPTKTKLSEINVGSFPITFSLKNKNLKWSDTQNSEDRTLYWNIEKATRTLKISDDKLYFNLLDEAETIEKNISLYYSGKDEFIIKEDAQNLQNKIFHKQLGNNKNITFYVNKKEIQKDFENTYEFYIEENENYKKSNSVFLKCYVSYWDWKETEISKKGAKWLENLQKYISYNGAKEEWIGKTKSFYSYDDNKYNQSNYITFQCVGVNQDGKDSVTFLTNYASNTMINEAAQDNGTLPFNERLVDNYESEGGILKFINNFFITHPNAFPCDLNILKNINKKYWDGENIRIAKNYKFFIPSACELGITDSDIPQPVPGTYWGGLDIEYNSDLVDPYPYSYFINNSKRIRSLNKESENVGVNYWTRSTSDANKDTEDSMRKINSKQIIITPEGTPSVSLKNNSLEVYYIFGFVIEAGKEVIN